MRKNILLLTVLSLMVACSIKQPNSDEDKLNITSKFKATWNVHESVEVNDDGTLTYRALPWGGLVCDVREHKMPVDLSEYESITFEFAKPTKVMTQYVLTEKLKRTAKPGITSFVCEFDGQDVSSVDEIVLQASDSTTIEISDVYYTPASSRWEPEKIWEGECVFGHWTGGFVIEPEKFESARAGDKLEFIYRPDTSNKDGYWLFKTIYPGTESTLEGNAEELNLYGCATVGRDSRDYRINLTANDVANLKVKGLFTNGYYNVVTRCNLLHKVAIDDYEENDEN